MELLPIFYAGTFLITACLCYGCCLAIAKLKPFAARSFAAVLTFGACAYVGFFLVILGLYHSPLRSLEENGLRSFTYVLAYVIPGLSGSWFLLWAMKVTRTQRESRTPSKRSS